jgi:hypothetical protein
MRPIGRSERLPTLAGRILSTGLAIQLFGWARLQIAFADINISPRRCFTAEGPTL